MELETQARSPVTRARRVRVCWRVVWTIAAVHAVAAFGQAVLAGAFLGGDYDMLGLHAGGADIVSYLVYGLLVSTVALWALGGPRWPAAASALLVAAETGQYFAGLAGALPLHLPLGVTIVAGALFLLVALSRSTPDAGRPR